MHEILTMSHMRDLRAHVELTWNVKGYWGMAASLRGSKERKDNDMGHLGVM